MPPDLIVEILSPSDRRGAVREKIREYIRAGVPLIWLVDPELQITTVYAGSIRGGEVEAVIFLTRRCSMLMRIPYFSSISFSNQSCASSGSHSPEIFIRTCWPTVSYSLELSFAAILSTNGSMAGR